MLDSLHLTHFKAHRDLTVGLSPVTVLVGPNGCGKSTVMEALICLSRLAAGATSGEVFTGPRALPEVRSVGSTGAIALETTGSLAGDRFRCAWTSTSEGDSFDLSWSQAPSDTARSGPRPLLIDPRLKRHLRGAVWRRFEPSLLAKPGNSDDVHPRLHDDGRGLAPFLADMKLTHDSAFNDLTDALRQVIPSVRALRFERVELPDEHVPEFTLRGHDVFGALPRAGTQILLDTVHGKGIPAHRVSGGMLLTLGLLATLFDPAAPNLVLLEEPERALHPRAFYEFVHHLRRLTALRPELQVVMASHSPYLVSAFEPEEVQLFGMSPEGHTTCVRLDAHPDFEKWRDVMLPGELWVTLDPGSQEPR